MTALRLGVLAALLTGLIQPAATAREIVTPIASGRVLVQGNGYAEIAKYVHEGCARHELDAVTTAFVNIAEYRGKTLRIHGDDVDMGIGIPGLWTTRPGIGVREVASCDLMSALYPKALGGAWAGKPVTFVATGVFVRITSLDALTVGQHFRVELVEEIP